MKKSNIRRAIPLKVWFVLAAILAIGWIIPQHIEMPVEGATRHL